MDNYIKMLGKIKSKDEFLEFMNLYAKNTKERHRIRLRKSQIIYWSIASAVILGLLIGIIIVAVNL